MAGRSRINRLIGLVSKDMAMMDGVDWIDDESITVPVSCENYSPKAIHSRDHSPRPGCSNSYSSMPGNSKQFSTIPGCSKNLFSEPDNDVDIFTDSDETFLVCLDIVSMLIDSLPYPNLDYSTDSSDDFIPNTCDTSSSDCSVLQKRTRRNSNVIIPESDSDTSNNKSFWDKEGIKQGRKHKPRKSIKERRVDRETRKKKRNLGKSYETGKGKKVEQRKIKGLGSCRMKCAERIPEEFRNKIFNYYWSLGDYDRRVLFISNLIDVKGKASTKLAATVKNRHFTNNYCLKLHLECHRICKGCFLKTFDETPKFIQNVTGKIKESGGIVAKSTRGKKPSALTIDNERLENVKTHILSFPIYESHYGRSKTNKKFLPPHLTLQDMYKSYCEDNENPVSLTIYSWVFRAQNLSFKTPYVDTCVKCDTLNTKIKFCDGLEKENTEKLLEEHQRRAETIYDQKSKDRACSIEKGDTAVLSFDLQQCLPTPFLKTGAAFYKRALWTYNLTLRDCTHNKCSGYVIPGHFIQEIQARPSKSNRFKQLRNDASAGSHHHMQDRPKLKARRSEIQSCSSNITMITYSALFQWIPWFHI
ncbi:unnamed protein product [Diatraea saccharalis]|uniref:Uncharacterized protein n=1 Tax=Diatraea saccharalis TaxID=40085 RepID=A0A9P0C3I7_9NEOP|nr:unnamed protein product [Diatraea saccharalis]